MTPFVATARGINGETLRVDMYGATNLNFIMDNNRASDGLPDPNTTYTVRGFIGDHPDNDSNLFRFAGDADVYGITLQAGQILRLGALQGTALRANVQLFTANGTALTGFVDSTIAQTLPSPTAQATDPTVAQTYLIRQTGTYYIVVGNSSAVFNPAVVPNPDTTPNSLGDYNFTVNVFDDGDSGFNSSTDSGDGTLVVNPPAASDFNGPNGTTIPSIISGGYTFVRNADGSVTGTNGQGVVSTRSASGTTTTNTISAAIGPAGHAGVPNALIASDIDVFHLNNRLPITPGTKMKVTIKLSDLGADLGSANPETFEDNRGVVQFGLFDTSASTAIDDAVMVFSPTDFLPFGGTPNTTIAQNDSTRYGYDANGDFYIEFVVPDRAGSPGTAGTFAVYVQGAFNTDYGVEVVTGGTGENIRRTQNVLLETNGGSISWLQAGGVTTNLNRFDLKSLGFSGGAGNGQTINQYVLSQLVSQLNALFQGSTAGSGFDVRFSTDPSDFEFQPFSTVYVTTTSDPVLPLTASFGDSFNFSLLSNGFVLTQPYGFSQHSDPLNTDIEDDAVVFLPSFATKGVVPDVAGADTIAQALTGAVARRVGELMGLRVSNVVGTGTIFDPFASDSVDNQPGAGRSYTITNTARDLSGSFDSITRTNFFLGRQNAFSLLDKVLSRR